MQVIFHYVAGDWLRERLRELSASRPLCCRHRAGRRCRLCRENEDVRGALARTEAGDGSRHPEGPALAAHSEAWRRRRHDRSGGRAGAGHCRLQPARNECTRSRRARACAYACGLAEDPAVRWRGRERDGAGAGRSSDRAPSERSAGVPSALSDMALQQAGLRQSSMRIGASVLYTTRREMPGAVGTRVSLDELLERSDIVSLHVPYNDATRGMIDRSRIARMKPGAILINTARGGLVDQEALVDALRSGHLAGAGLDTFASRAGGSGKPVAWPRNRCRDPARGLADHADLRPQP